jgi:ribonuclease HI
LIVKVAIKVLNNFQINSKLVWECHQSLVKLSEHDRVQLILVPGHTGIDGNETADQLARKGSTYPLTGPEPALGIGCQRGDQGLET